MTSIFPLPPLDTSQWCLAAAAALGLGISRYGFPGIYMLVVVGFAQAMPGTSSMAAIQPLILFGNVMVLRVLLQHICWVELRRIMPSSLLGVAMGILVVRWLPPHGLTRLVGAVVLAQVIWFAVQKFLPQSAAQFSSRTGAIWGIGIIAGIATMVANVATPILTMHLLSAQLARERFAATLAGIFLVLTLVKFPVTYALGFYGGDELSMDLLMIPIVAAGLPLGRWLLRVLPTLWVDGLSIVATCLAAVRMLVFV